MPAIATTALEINGVALTAVSGTSLGTSSALSNATPYLVLMASNASTTGSSGDDVDGDFLVGGTTYAVLASQHDTFSPSGSLDAAANGGLHQSCAVFTHTPASGTEVMDFQAWGDVASGDGVCRAYALDLSNLVLNSDRWHDETANNATIVTTPASGSGWVDVHTLTFTPPSAGEYLIFASMEMVGNGATSAFNEFAARLEVDGSVVAGTYLYQDIGGRADTVLGYATATVQTLTTSSTDIVLQMNGTNSSGNIGVRRLRIHAIRVGAIDGSDVQEINDAAETVATTADFATGTIGNGSDDYLMVARANKQAPFWTQTHMLAGGTETPANGFGSGLLNFGVGAANDMGQEFGLTVVSAPAASTAVGIRGDKVGGGGSALYGTDVSRADAGETALITLRLATPDSAILLTPDADRVDFNTPAPDQILGAVTQSPAALVSQYTTPAPTVVLGAVTSSPAAEGGQFVTPAPTLALSGVTITPAAEVAQWTDPAPAVSLGATTLAPAALVGQWNTPAAAIALGTVTLTPAAEVGQWTTNPAVASLSGGPITLAPPVTRAQWTTPAAVVDAPAVLTPGALQAQYTTPAPTVALGGAVRQPAALRARWATPSATVALGAVTAVPGAVRGRWTTLAPTVGNVLQPAALALQFTVPAPAVVIGAAVRQPAAVRTRWVTPTPIVEGGEDLFRAPYGMAVADFTTGMTIAPDLSMGMLIDED